MRQAITGSLRRKKQLQYMGTAQKMLAQLKAGQEFPPPRENLYDRFMSGPVNPVFYRFL